MTGCPPRFASSLFDPKRNDLPPAGRMRVKEDRDGAGIGRRVF
jgi:hypothetical protein